MLDTPLARYERDLQKDGFLPDVAQRRAVERLQQLFDELVAYHREGRSFLTSVLPWRRKSEPPQGVYLWGGVGRGKTYLMDVFFEALPLQQKMRTHFHRFMRRVHSELTALKGEKNPLDKVADTLAAEARVICFDEFFVADITDAMILANLLKALFARGVTLVTTSNIQPDGLYKDGLQRERFIPAIHLLNAHLDVMNVDGGVDYRLRALVKADLFHSPLNEAAEQALHACFHRLVPESSTVHQDVSLEVEGRNIKARYESDDIVWFDFPALCDGPRSQNDYIVLAKEYHAVLVSGVPQFTGKNDDQARRFIYMVDEFYDRRVKLVLSGASPIPSLYVEGRLGFEFQRTVSRLLEMQSEEYLAQAHRP
ncbi:MAG: cell division protein ZapE [Cellvibrionaceae bacterium]|nr:cell division protein ZapE [Cellvibrionaceae bacterium]